MWPPLVTYTRDPVPRCLKLEVPILKNGEAVVTFQSNLPADSCSEPSRPAEPCCDNLGRLLTGASHPFGCSVVPMNLWRPHCAVTRALGRLASVCHSSARAADVTPGEVLTAAFKFLKTCVQDWCLEFPVAHFQAGCQGSQPPRRAARVPATSTASCTGAGGVGTARVGVGRPGPRARTWCSFTRFLQRPPERCVDRETLGRGGEARAGPCVHAGPDPAVGQHLVTCRCCGSDVPARSRSGQSSLVKVRFPPAREQERKGRAFSCVDLCHRSR